jgi:hypothetical protein
MTSSGIGRANGVAELASDRRRVLESMISLSGVWLGSRHAQPVSRLSSSLCDDESDGNLVASNGKDHLSGQIPAGQEQRELRHVPVIATDTYTVADCVKSDETPPGMSSIPLLDVGRCSGDRRCVLQTSRFSTTKLLSQTLLRLAGRSCCPTMAPLVVHRRYSLKTNHKIVI